MRCLYCGNELALLKKLTGGGEFCSEAHRQKYQEEYNRLALSRLLQAQPATAERPHVVSTAKSTAAAVAINRGKDVQRVMPLIKARVQVDPAKLGDENVDLRSLMPGARPVRTHQHRVVPHPVARPGEEAR